MYEFNDNFILTLRFMTTIILNLGFGYQALLASNGPDSALVQSLEVFFREASFSITLTRNLRNYVCIIVGRFVINLVVYGPVLTFQVIYSSQAILCIVRNLRLIS